MCLSKRYNYISSNGMLMHLDYFHIWHLHDAEYMVYVGHKNKCSSKIDTFMDSDCFNCY